MEIKFDAYSTACLFGIIQALVLAAILFRMKRGNRNANRIMGLFLIIIATSIFIYFILETTNLYYYLPHLIGFSIPMLFLYGPFLFFYIRALTTPDFRLRARSFLHFIPALACLLFLSPFYLQSAEDKIAYLQDVPRDRIVFDNLNLAWLCALVYVFVYIVISKRVLYRYTKSIKEIFSNIDRINFKWFRFFFTLFSVCWYLIIMITIADVFIFKLFFLSRIIPVLVTASVFLFGYVGLVHRNVTEDPVFREAVGKYKKSALGREKSLEHMRAVSAFMEKEKPHLEPDLTLPGLAERLNINRNDLSRVINEATGQNFYDFINKYRVEAVKRLMQDPGKKHLTLLALAFEAGFNSKATFNIAFKKHTSLTPREYMKKPVSTA